MATTPSPSQPPPTFVSDLLSQNERNVPRNLKTLANDATSPLFLAVIEATEEAIYNSLFKATTTSGRGRTVEALPLDRTRGNPSQAWSNYALNASRYYHDKFTVV